MPDLPGHDRREERRAKRQGRRIVRDGDEFNSDELQAGTVELEQRKAVAEEPEGGGYEPWALDDSKERPERDRERLRIYMEFVASRRQDGDDPDVDT